MAKNTPPKKKSARRPAAKQASHTHVYASVFPQQNDGRPLPPRFVDTVRELEAELGMPVFLFVQDGRGTLDQIDGEVTKRIFGERGRSLERGQEVAVVIDSYGGQASSAFELANLFQRYCGGFTAIIPRHAKSAATLMSLGADKILMCEFGELGPLDMQVSDPESEDFQSVLDELQALERLTAYTMTAIDDVMFLLLSRTGKKVATLLPQVTEIVSAMVRARVHNLPGRGTSGRARCRIAHGTT